MLDVSNISAIPETSLYELITNHFLLFSSLPIIATTMNSNHILRIVLCILVAFTALFLVCLALHFFLQERKRADSPSSHAESRYSAHQQPEFPLSFASSPPPYSHIYLPTTLAAHLAVTARSHWVRTRLLDGTEDLRVELVDLRGSEAGSAPPLYPGSFSPYRTSLEGV
jgi:hypothetical protein